MTKSMSAGCMCLCDLCAVNVGPGATGSLETVQESPIKMVFSARRLKHIKPAAHKST